MTDGAGPVRTDDPLRRSIEVEYWVIDESGRLTEPNGLVDAAPGVEREFVAPLLEIKTSPCVSTDVLRTELFDRLQGVLQRADELGLGLVPMGTPAHAGAIEDRPSRRTAIQDRILGDNFEYVRHCAGTHIHVEQRAGREIEQLNVLTALDPALALVNSSPYFGRAHLTNGARSKLYRRMAYESLPWQGNLWPYSEATSEWAQKLERRYEEFVTEAIIAGVDRETVTSCFEPESAVWTPVKLRGEFSTVEWRSPDAALPSQVLRLADDVVGLVERIGDVEVRVEGRIGGVTDESIVLPEFDVVRELVDAAIRDGLASTPVRSYLDRMGFDVSRYDPLTEEMAASELSPAAAREHRLAYAERLRNDVRHKKPAVAD